MLSPRAEQLIHNYFNLPFKGVSGVRCPYFNNAKRRERGQLRALIGKGAPAEIVEEAQIISIQYHAGLFDRHGNCCLHDAHENSLATAEAIRKFLIDHDLGIECSGFVTQVLREHYKETKNFDFVKKMFITSIGNLPRWLISRLRPVENISVRHYADDRNTTRVEKFALKPGDLITMLETGPANKRNHILLVTGYHNATIEYVHARAWSSEGMYDHGVSRGTITITKPAGSLLDQRWSEKDMEGDRNETYLEAKRAKKLDIRRLRF